MAKTILTTSSNETVLAYSEQVFRDVKKESFFERFTGPTKNSIVHEQRDLEKGKGDKVRFPLVMRLSGSGVSGTEKMESNEESLTTYTFDLDIDLYRHAVRDDGAMT